VNTGTTTNSRSPGNTSGSGGLACSHHHASKTCAPSVAASGQPGARRGIRIGTAPIDRQPFGAVIAPLIATQRWSSCSVSSSERRVKADRSFIVSAARCRRATLCAVQVAGIMVTA